MYRFHSLAETPVRLKGHWYTIMVGVNPNRESTNLKKMQDNIFDFFILNRNPKEGIYVEGAQLDQVAAFLSFAHHNPNRIIDLHKKYAESGLNNPTVTLDEVIEQGGIDLTQPIEDFEIDPSFEPFILPSYVNSELEFRKRQIFERAQPYIDLCKAAGIKIEDDTFEYNRWVDRNASFARLAYVIKDSTYFKPLNYCREANHYWDWFKAKSGTLFLRTVYIASPDSNTNVQPKEEQLSEFEVIPEAICPIHNEPLKLIDGFYIGKIPVSNEEGIHMRPAQTITEDAQKYSGQVFISQNGTRANAKEIMQLFELNALRGDILKVELEDVGDPGGMNLLYKRIYKTATTELR